MSLIQTAKEVMGNEYLAKVISNFTGEYFRHPYLMSRENYRFLSRWLLGRVEKPGKGLVFENHCHSHFSERETIKTELADVVNLLFDKGIGICSLTDHDNSEAFDSLNDGRYNLDEKSTSGQKYELELNPDGRSMVIHKGSKKVILLRSIEYLTDKGELGIHGYSGKLPRENIPVSEAIERALDMGAWIVINHPYFWTGIGFNDRGQVESVAKKPNIAIEKNGTEIPPQIYCPVRAESEAESLSLPLIAGGDSHLDFMYGLSGLIFNENEYGQALDCCGKNHADAIKAMVFGRKFGTYFNYLTPGEFLRFFKF